MSAVSIVKTFRHTARATVVETGPATVESPGGSRLRAGLPREFVGGADGAWSGEELLVAAAASSFAATLAALADRRGVSLGEITVEGEGLVERRPSGRYEFAALELAVTVGGELPDRALQALAAEARERAVVASALGVPLHVRLLGLPAVAGGVRGPGPRA